MFNKFKHTFHVMPPFHFGFRKIVPSKNLSGLTFILLSGLLASSLFSCKKDIDPLDIVPAIEVLSISPSIANEYTDAVVIRISYTDGDGDLGENSATVKNCFVTDNRIGITSAYRIRQLSPDQSSIPIKGSLDIELGGQGIVNGSSQQDVTFSIYVVDRAGHTSNTVTTNAVRIKKP